MFHVLLQNNYILTIFFNLHTSFPLSKACENDIAHPQPPTIKLIVLLLLLIVKTQRNSTQRNSKATSVGVRHSSHVYPTPPTTNFSATSRPARELKFGTDTH